MVGLAPVKEQIQELVAAAEIDSDRAQLGLPVKQSTMHLVFTGAPGTGKTSVAREIGNMYYNLGLVDKDPSTDEGFVEVGRSGLVAEYLGQTAKNVQRLFEGEDGDGGSAGGVIFVDEAYDLYHGEQDSFGKEAITELLRQAENHRDNTVVIMAGYGPQMETLFDSNPGLRRRFPTTLDFPEMSLDDRYKVMQLMMKQSKYSVGAKGSPEADDVREAMVDALRYTGTGNGGDVRNLFDRITTAQKMRLVKQKAKGDLKPADYARLTVDDVKIGTDAYIKRGKADQPLAGRLAPTGRQKAKKPKGRLELVS